MARPRGQASLAISVDDRDRVVLNASPDLRQPIEQTPPLQPPDGLRTPIAVVGLTGGDVDGLLTLRERQPFTLLAAPRVHAVLDANPMFEVLGRPIISRRALPIA